MTFHEYGTQNEKVIVLIHPSAVMWDYFSYLIPLLERDFHLLIPALPGYDESNPDMDYTSVEEIASQIAGFLSARNIDHIDLLYGCSMGGSIVIRMLADRLIAIDNAVIDGGITPYQLPRIITRLIAARDFLMVSMGKIGGLKLLEKVFSTDEYSAEDLKYMEKTLGFMSYRTIWRTFESCNNYRMPDPVPEIPGHMEYWYGDKEQKDRKWDIRYIRKNFPQARLVRMKNCGHASMASLHPEKMTALFRKLLQ